MTFRACLLFSKKLIFPRSAKKSSARKSVIGAIVCIAISIVPLIAVISVSDGMIGGMTERMIELSTGHLNTRIFRNAEYKYSAEAMLKTAQTISKIDGITKSYPEISIEALASGNKMRTGIQVRAIPPEILIENQSFTKYLKVLEGNLQGFSTDEKNAVIGEKIASILNLKCGDTIRIITTKSGGGKTITPRLTSFKICAIVSSGYQELDALWVFVPFKTAFSFVPQENGTFTIVSQTTNAFSSDLYRIRKEISDELGLKTVTYTWSELNEAQLENFSSTKILLIFVMTLIVLVASINISSALVMLVMERRREIAILKSTGATSRGITLSFLMTGAYCGLLGIIIGLPVGLLCAVNINSIISVLEKIMNGVKKIAYLLKGGVANAYIDSKLLDPAYYLTEIPIAIPVGEILAILVFVLLLCVLVSIIPAIKAGQEKPLDIIRKM